MATRLITFVTSNTRKFATAVEHLSPAGIELEQVALDLDEIQADSVVPVALHKAQQAFRALHRPVIIEDSGFYIDELDGFPGPFARSSASNMRWPSSACTWWGPAAVGGQHRDRRRCGRQALRPRPDRPARRPVRVPAGH